MWTCLATHRPKYGHLWEQYRETVPWRIVPRIYQGGPVRKLLIGLLALFRRTSLLILKLRGKTAADVAEQRVVSGKSWDEFCDTLKAADACGQVLGV